MSRLFLDEAELRLIGMTETNITTLRALAKFVDVQSQVQAAQNDIEAHTTSIADLAANDAILNARIEAAEVVTSDPTITALAGFNSNGLVTQIGPSNFSGRTITAGTGISVADGDGVSGDPTITCTVTGVSDGDKGDVVVSSSGAVWSLDSAVVTTFARTFLDDTSAGAVLTTLGATTIGANLFTLANPSAVTFPRYNADNTVSALSASAFRAAIGAGVGGGDLVSTNNLSDLTNAATARTNLGLGTLATQSGTFSGTSSGTNTGDQTSANPSATASDTAVNGSASTFMRSDAAPAIQKASSSVFGLVKVDGSTITASGGVISASGGGSSITVKDEGSNLTTALTSMNFVGAGVTATNTSGAVTVTIPGGSTFRGALVTKSANQTGANYTTRTALAWDAEVYDTDSIHDNATNNSRLTVPSGVTYVRLKGQVQVEAVTTSLYGLLVIWKNGTAAYQGEASQLVYSGNVGVQWLNLSSPPLAVSAGDYFQLALEIQTDTSVDVVKDVSWFAMEIIA